ncbi:XS domain-containing protein/zf-XS domain-containing protein, partial [Cephalotus follicularis]
MKCLHRGQMDYSSEESDIGESELDEYKDKPYEQLQAGKLKVKINGTLSCPFCAGKKKQDYKYKDLLQHASGVAKGSANRSGKQKANHLALAKYLEIDLASEMDQGQPLVVTPVIPTEEQEDMYVWPWMGIIVNLVAEEAASLHGDHFLQKFSRYKPLEVHTFLNEQEVVSEAIVTFNNDWNGFMNATEFEKAFETEHHGKKDWSAQKLHPGTSIYGWCARADDYVSRGAIGEFLRMQGKLRTISGIVQEVSRVVAKLAIKIDMTNENLDQLHYKYNEKTMSLTRMLEEKDRLHSVFVEETRNLQRYARHSVQRILEEQEKLSYELETRKRKLDNRSKELNKREAMTEPEKQKLDDERKKLASMEQRKADENVLRLVEEQKREKEDALNKILQLEKQLDAKQKLEMDIEELKGKLQVMKHLGDDDDAAVQAKMQEMTSELEEKIEDLENLV